MDLTYVIILRLIHISTGIFWAGTIFYLVRFIMPAAKALGPEGGKFMQQLMSTNKLPLVMMLSATLNIISGILLIEYLSDGFQSDWFGTPMGITLSIGGTAALIAYIVGMTMNRPAGTTMEKIAKQVAASGGIPTPEQINQLQQARNTLSKATQIVAWLLLVAVITMAIGRYMR